MPKLKNCRIATKAPNYLTRMECLVCFYFIRINSKTLFYAHLNQNNSRQSEITATIKLNDTEHLDISRKRCAIYCKVMTIFIEKSVAPNFYDNSLFVCEKLILKTKFLPIKKEEISPKTSSSELDRYLIHRCHYYSYLKKSPLGKRLENCGELFLLTLLAMLKTSTRR